MSGHGGFGAIGNNNLPQFVNIGINSINGPIVNEPRVGGANTNVGNVNAPVANERLEQADRIVAKLDAMLAKAVQLTTTAVDTKGFAASMKKLKLPKALQKTLNDAAKKAQTAFQSLNKFSGSQIAAAIVTGDSGFSWDDKNPAGKTIKEALDAMMDFSEQIADAMNSLPKGTGALKAKLEEAMLQNDRRASEMQTLICEFADMAAKKGTDPAISARLEQTLESLIPAKSLKMHDAHKVVAEFRTSMMPLAQEIDKLAAESKERTVTDNELLSIRSKIQNSSNALELAEQKFVQNSVTNGVSFDRSIFTSAKGILADFSKRLTDIRRDVAYGSMRNFIDKAFSTPDIPLYNNEKFRPIFKVVFPAITQALETQKMLKEAALKFLDKHDPKSQQKMEYLASQLADLDGEVGYEVNSIKEGSFTPSDSDEYKLSDLLASNSENADGMRFVLGRLTKKERAACTADFLKEFRMALVKFTQGDQINPFSDSIGGVKTQTSHLVQMLKNADNIKDPLKFTTTQTLSAAFEGKMAMTTIVETRMAGLPDIDANPALDDSKLISSSQLGSGNVNTVLEVTYSNDDGKSWIFKPESQGRQAFNKLNLSWESYEDSNLLAQLNMASQRTADSFGFNDIMTKTSVGSHKGQFGMFMEKAPGRCAKEYAFQAQNDKPGSLTSAQIKNLDDETHEKVIGELMRKANRLEWFDLLTGQGDRHGGNYMVNVDEKGNVSLKAIDNDACFGLFMVGPGLFRLEGKHAQVFEQLLAMAKTKIYPNGAAEQQALRIDNDPGIERRGGTIIVNAAKVQAKEILYCLSHATGCWRVKPPEFIDRDVYNKLISMRQGSQARQDYIDELKSRLSDAQIEVAIKRLDNAIAYAQKLANDNRVISSEDWGKHEVQRNVAGKAPDQFPSVNNCEPKNNEKVTKIIRTTRRLDSSLFRRDFLSTIAKPGWFDK